MAPNANGNASKRRRVASPSPSPEPTPAELTAKYQDQCMALGDKLRDLAHVTADEIKDNMEFMQRSIKKQLKEAKAPLNNKDSLIDDLKRQNKALEDELKGRKALFNKSLTSRTQLQKKISSLEQQLADQASAVQQAKQSQQAAEAALAPTRTRLATINNIGRRTHTMVLARVCELRNIGARFDALPADEERERLKLETQFSNLSEAMRKAWGLVEEDYMRETGSGKFPEFEPASEEPGPDVGDVRKTTEDGVEDRGSSEDTDMGGGEVLENSKAEEESGVQERMFVGESESPMPTRTRRSAERSYTPSPVANGNSEHEQEAPAEEEEDERRTPESAVLRRRGSLYGLPVTRALRSSGRAKKGDP